jgi:hypothetical protein
MPSKEGVCLRREQAPKLSLEIDSRKMPDFFKVQHGPNSDQRLPVHQPCLATATKETRYKVARRGPTLAVLGPCIDAFFFCGWFGKGPLSRNRKNIYHEICAKGCRQHKAGRTSSAIGCADDRTKDSPMRRGLEQAHKSGRNTDKNRPTSG